MYFVIGEFPLYGGAQETLALRLQISRTFTSNGEAGTSKYYKNMIFKLNSDLIFFI